MSGNDLAGKLPPYQILINVPRLISAYYTYHPDPKNPAQQVAFGTSGHRGSSLSNSFNEDHILAISQAIVYEVDAESFKSEQHLERIQAEAQTIVNAALN